jgi:hypothetical protein
LLFIKYKQKEVRNNRNELKKLKYKLDEYIQKDLFILSNNTTSSSFSSLLDPDMLPQNWNEEQKLDFIINKIINDRTPLVVTNGDED